jgi:hypothetical protein
MKLTMFDTKITRPLYGKRAPRHNVRTRFGRRKVKSSQNPDHRFRLGSKKPSFLLVEWCTQEDDFRTFLSDLVVALPEIDSSAGLSP